MKFHPSGPSKVMSYVCRPVGESKAIALAELRKAEDYRRKLVTLHEQTRQNANAIVSEYPSVAELQAEFDAAHTAVVEMEQAIKRRNAEAKRKTATKTDRASLKALRSRRVEAKNALYAERKRVKALPNIKAQQTILWDKDKIESKRLRAACGIYWGTYIKVEAAASSSKGKGRRHRMLSIQFQKGADPTDVLANKNKKLLFDGLPQRPDEEGKRIGRKDARCRARFLIGTDPDRYVDLYVAFDKFPPPESRIKWASLVAMHPWHEWRLQLSIEAKNGFHPRPDLSRDGSVGIDVGWRTMPHGLRVAYWYGDDGREGELTVPLSDIVLPKKATELRSIRDLNANAILIKLRERKDGAPQWFKDRLQYVRHAGGMSRLFIDWERQRWNGDHDLFETALKWYKQERHLWKWETNCRRVFGERRKHLYRNFARNLSRHYRVICMEGHEAVIDGEKTLVPGLKLTDMTRKPNVEDADTRRETARRNAALSLLISCLKQCGAKLVARDPAMTTRRCHICGSLTDDNQEKTVNLSCRRGHRWDQDRNAAINLLRGPMCFGETKKPLASIV